MTEINHPKLDTKKIIVATFAALIIGIIILVTAVLPAEYGIDPTGIGKRAGFTKLYQPAEQNILTPSMGIVAQPAYKLLKLEGGGSEPEIERPAEANNPAPEKQYEEREDSIQISIRAGKGMEYKVRMLKYGRLKFEWQTDKGAVYYDCHGDVKQANPPKDIYFESYAISYSNNVIGNIVSPYEGKHGWYFKNINAFDIKISIRMKGQYEIIN